MAAMEHVCPCGHWWFDNKATPQCPRCGTQGDKVQHFTDEVETPLELDSRDPEPQEEEIY